MKKPLLIGNDHSGVTGNYMRKIELEGLPSRKIK